jgi:Mg-chelatase subunit ChlD
MMNLLRKLGAELFGSNEDLIPVRDPSEADDVRDGDPDSDETTEGEDADGEGGSESDESDETEDGDGSESGESDDGSEGDDESGMGESDADGDADDESGDSGSEGDSGSDSGDDGSESGESDGSGDDSENDGESGDPTPTEAGEADGAGGHTDLGDDPQAFIEAILAGLEDPEQAGLLDNNEAMKQATDANRDDDCHENEQMWSPYDESADKVVKPRGSKANADAYQRDARVLTAALKAQFRRKFLAERNPREQHGVRRGRDLSERRLVESFIEIKSNAVPSRPDYRIEEKRDVTLSVAVVGDESGSMSGRRAQAAATAMIAIAEAFDSLGAPVMCCGPRNGGGYMKALYEDRDFASDMGMDDPVYTGGHHRHDPVRIDLFKDWDESFRKCKDRFGAYTATGGTPLSDGIQYALRALNERTERYRVVLVLTDGVPNCPEVVRRQIRVAREAGIHVVGVGICGAEDAVPDLFTDHHIVVPNLDALPKRMMEVVGGIVFPKRGRKANLDGGSRRRQKAQRAS